MSKSRHILLSRDDFREGVLARDGHKCVLCGQPAQDAHHIIERRLWSDGGYYLDNGASVCGPCHIKCETTEISVEEVREAAKVEKCIPHHFYPDPEIVYDKWGNIILPNKTRMMGELFHDESVQKILAQGGKLNLFSKYVKYQRTMHLDFSEGRTKDDRQIQNMDAFEGREMVVTKKMDGENTTFYNDYIHARSINSRSDESRDWVKQFAAERQYMLPEGWRTCGENCWAKHSIHYTDLKSYFYGFSIWDEKNRCLSWDDTLTYFGVMDIEPVPLIYRGKYDYNILKDIAKTMDLEKDEGFVVRVTDSFNFIDFKTHLAKFVRKNHVHTHAHWMQQAKTKNILASEYESLHGTKI